MTINDALHASGAPQRSIQRTKSAYDSANGHAYLTTADVAELLRTPIETIRYWRHVGKGPRSFRIGRRVLYDHEDVQAFIDQARNSDTQ